ncbi:unnamed protein product [Durusdinium trenchii]|uniref:Uncharacterized protein n=2 Tax=Durusdinium trenchii TaxID=1381693 RepID=A0ABP0R0L9_9DINO
MISDALEDLGSPMPATQIRWLGPLSMFSGLACGYGAVVCGLGQVGITVLAVTFFAAANMIPNEADSLSTLCLICFLLGGIMGFGGAAQMGDPRLPLFLVVVALFHITEFTFCVLFHEKEIEFRAFLLTPVPAAGYSVAIIAAMLEFWLWHATGLTLPGILQSTLLLLGASLAFGGWALRTAALFTARSNFTHIVASYKESSHRLVKEGVYSFCRHPGYVGWFLWSVSTQVLLRNVFCFFAYAWVSWRFFAGRIPHEEDMLIRFFGDEYVEYATHVRCGIPYVSRL